MLGCVGLSARMMDQHGSGLLPLVLLIVGGLFCLVWLYLQMPYKLLAMVCLSSSIVAFAYLDFDLVSLVYLLPLLLMGCFCLIRGFRHDKSDTNGNEPNAPADPPDA